MESIHLRTCKMRSLYTGDLSIQVVFRAGLTVYDVIISPLDMTGPFCPSDVETGQPLSYMRLKTLYIKVCDQTIKR